MWRAWLVKLGASQSTVQSDATNIIPCLGPSCPISRAPNHRLRLQDARAVRCSLGPCNTSGARAAAAGWRGSERQPHRGDIEEALAVRRRRRWAAWRGGAWSSFAVLSRSFWGGASASVHRQSGRCARWRASCASPLLCTETV